MIPKGLSQYQAVQKSAREQDATYYLEKIAEKAKLYDIAYLQNRTLMESIVALPEQSIDAKRVKNVEMLLSWFLQTQEGATLS